MADLRREDQIPLEEVETFRRQMIDIDRTAKSISQSLTAGLKAALVDGKSLESVFRQIALSASSKVLASALGPLESLSGEVISKILPFARGGIVSSPSVFGLGAGTAGLMGEDGPEAILPLARGPDGRLGVHAGGGNRLAMPSVQINVTTRDAESFRRSETQVSAMVARAVGRGRRGL